MAVATESLVDALRQRAFRTAPYEHQLGGLAELLEHPRWLLAWEMGTGKSWVLANRVRIGLERNQFSGPVLIVCPKSVLAVWPGQLEQHTGITPIVVSGTKRQRDAAIASIEADSVVVTNYETCRTEVAGLIKAGFDVVACDESHRIKNSRSQTAKAVRKIARGARCRWALSGSPAPNGPLDIHGTLTFLDTKLLGTESFYAFRNRFAVMGGFQQKQIVDYRDLPVLENIVAGVSSRVRKEDALDLPEKVFLERRCELSPAAQRLYKQLRDEAIAELTSKAGAGTLSITNILTQSMRLLQLVGGFVPDNDGKLHPIEPNAKLGALLDVLEDVDGQAIIWASFVAEADAIYQKLRDDAVVFCGRLLPKQRELALEQFKQGDARYFIATPQSAREGLTLTEASTAIFYSRTYNLLDWSQAQDRLHRIGQTRSVSIVSLVASGTVDEKVSVAIARKTDLQELILAGTRLEDLL